MKEKTLLNQGILGYVQTPKGSIAVRVMNDVFVNYMFEKKENWEILRSLLNILIEDMTHRYTSTSVSPVSGELKVSTQYAYLTKNTPMRQDVAIDADNLTYVEFQNFPHTNEPIRLRAVEYFTLSLSTREKGETRAVKQIWLLSQGIRELTHDVPYVNYVWVDEVTQNKYPVSHSMMFVNLEELSKERGTKVGELAAFLLGDSMNPVDQEVATVAKAFKKTYTNFRRNKGAMTVLSYTEEREAIGRAEGIEIGKAEGEAKGKVKGKVEGVEETKRETALKMLGLGMDIDVIVAVTGLSNETIIELQKKLAADQPTDESSADSLVVKAVD